MGFGRRAIRSMGLGFLVTALMATGGASIMAQDATPAATPADAVVEVAEPRPAHIHAGSCPEVGDVVGPLNDLTTATGDAAATDTGSGAIPAEYSFTTVPLTLEAILGGEHAINVHESAENIQNYIACGDLAGSLDANGSLVVGLGELNDSGYTGIAVLSPSLTEGSTDVSVFIASDTDGI